MPGGREGGERGRMAGVGVSVPAKGTPPMADGRGSRGPTVPARLESTGRNGPLHSAAQRGNGAEAQKLVVEGYDVSMRGTGGNTPLHLAALHDNLEVLEVLLNCGASCEVANAMGNTPLHWAAHSGSVRCAEALLRLGGAYKLMTINVKGETPHALALQRGHDGVAQLLMQWEEKAQSRNRRRDELAVGATYVPGHDPDLGPPVAGVRFSADVSRGGEAGGAEAADPLSPSRPMELALFSPPSGRGQRAGEGEGDAALPQAINHDAFTTKALSQATMRAVNAEVELGEMSAQNDELRRQTYQARFETQNNNKMLKELQSQVKIMSSTVEESLRRIQDADERTRISAREIDRLVELYNGSAAENARIVEQNELLRSRNDKLSAKNDRVHQGVLDLHNALFGPAFKPFKESELDGVLSKCVEAVRMLIGAEEKRNAEIRDLQAQVAGIDLTRYGVNPHGDIADPGMVAAFASLRGASGLKHRAKQLKLLNVVEAGTLPNSMANPLRAAHGQLDATPDHLVS